MTTIFDEIIENARTELNNLLTRDDIDERVLNKTRHVLLVLTTINDSVDAETTKDVEPEWLTRAAIDVGLVRKRKKRTHKVLD